MIPLANKISIARSLKKLPGRSFVIAITLRVIKANFHFLVENGEETALRSFSASLIYDTASDSLEFRRSDNARAAVTSNLY